MFKTLKGYLTAGAAAIVLIFAALFKYRGSKIEDLEVEVKRGNDRAAVVAKVMEANKKAAQYEADNRVAKVEAEVIDEEDTNKYIPDTKFVI